MTTAPSFKGAQPSHKSTAPSKVGWPAIDVDTRKDRESNRTKLAQGKNVKEVEGKLLKVVPIDFKLDLHHWLIPHGRYTCVARKPKCGVCIIEDL